MFASSAMSQEQSEMLRFYERIEILSHVEVGAEIDIRLFFTETADSDHLFRVIAIAEGCRNRGGCRVEEESMIFAGQDTVNIMLSLPTPTPMIPICRPQRLELYLGIVDEESKGLVSLTQSNSHEDRLYIGHVRITEQPKRARIKTFYASNDGGKLHSIFQQWWCFFALFFAMLVLAKIITRYALTPVKKVSYISFHRVSVVIFVLSAVVLSYSSWLSFSYVKDDSYISFRIVRNIAAGFGPVFNEGERVEAMTTFLWVFLLAPFEMLGLDLVVVTKIIGIFAGLGTLVVMLLLVNRLNKRAGIVALFSAIWLASSSSVSLWLTSGMEQSLAMFLPNAALLVVFYAVEKQNLFLAKTGGILMGLACLLRPEIHLIGLFVGILVFFYGHNRRLSMWWVIMLLVITAPTHLFRFLYYDSLFPNTFLVKTGHGWPVFIAGSESLLKLLFFNNLWILVLLTPFAFISRNSLAQKRVMALSVIGFAFYIVWVGKDEMLWHRLFLPVLPMLLILAGIGLETLVSYLAFLELKKATKYFQTVVIIFCFFGLSRLIYENLHFTSIHLKRLQQGDLFEANVYNEIATIIRENAGLNDTLLLQDAGEIPYLVPEVRVIDFFGLTNKRIAQLSHKYELHAFVRSLHEENRSAFQEEVRNYLWSQDPTWVVLNSRSIQSDQEIRAAMMTQSGEEVLFDVMGQSGQQFDLYDERFREEFCHVQTWYHHRKFYVSLFARQMFCDEIF